EQTLKARIENLPPNHPDTLISQNNLAMAYRSAGRLTEAIPLMEQTLKATEEKLGPDHPNTLTGQNNLALVFESAGRLDEALSLYEQTLKVTKEKLGLDHPHTFTSEINLANAYTRMGRLTEALPLYEQTLKAQKEKLPPNHPNILNSQSNLAKTLIDAGRFDAVVKLIEVDLKVIDANPKSYWLTPRLRVWHGVACREAKDCTAAETSLRMGYAKLVATHERIPPVYRVKWLFEAANETVKLYVVWGKPALALSWRNEQAKWGGPAVAEPPEGFVPIDFKK
ncbi:MAG: tetratricopeptide repeat protein, partial [Planctomycetaceae bacterium]|nr:tetratricopeptide repeat protein [Planctomycetaceae bacterium]